MNKLLTTLSILLIATVSYAETITLTSGKVIEGEIVERTDEFIKVDTGIGVITTYYLDEIKNDFHTQPAVEHSVINPNGGNPEALLFYNKAEVLFENSQFNEAIETLKKVVRIEPDFVDAYILLGVVSELNSQYEIAISYLEKALKIDSKNSAINAFLGLNYNRLEEFDKALFHLKKAIEMQPNNLNSYDLLSPLESMTYALLTDTYLVLGKIQKAEELVNKAVVINPKNSDSMGVLANHYGVEGRTEDMIATLEKAVELNPEYIEGYMQLMGVYIVTATENNKRINSLKARDNALKAKELAEKTDGYEAELQQINDLLIDLDEFAAKIED